MGVKTPPQKGQAPEPLILFPSQGGLIPWACRTPGWLRARVGLYLDKETFPTPSHLSTAQQGQAEGHQGFGLEGEIS